MNAQESDDLRNALVWALELIPDECNCSERGGYLEYDTNAYIHTDDCRIFTRQHIEVVSEKLNIYLSQKDARIAALEEALNAMDNALDMLMQDEPTLQVNALLALKLVDARAKTRAALA